MKKKSIYQSAFFSLRIVIGLVAILSGVSLAFFATSAQPGGREGALKAISPSGGQEEWIAFYNGGNGFDVASSIAVDGSGNIYVTGSSVGPGSCNFYCNDYATIKYDASGTQQWVARYNGPANDDDHPAAIAVDSSGNVYVTGASLGTAWPDYDYATIKYDASGNQLWVARYNGPASDFDFATAIAVDGSGNVYVTGASEGSGTGPFDYATIKYDASGNQLWVARYNGPGNDDDEAYAIAVDASSNVYVTGYSAGSGTGNDYATVKYDSSGQQQWVARYNGPSNSNDYGHAIGIDGSGNIYVTGSSIGSSGFDYATVKYDSSGQQQWVARYNGPGNEDDEPYAMAVDSSGNVHVTGYSSGAGSGYDYTTIKYNTSGTEEWVARYNGAANLLDIAYAIALDAAGNVYVTGWSVGLGTGYDYATVKYDSSGQEQWVERYNGSGDLDDQAYAIAVDSSANVYVTGYAIDADGVSNYTTIKYSQSPTPTGAASRKVHGAAGTFDIPLPLTGHVGVECRSGGATNAYQMIINFATSVTVDSASVTSGTGSVSGFSVSGSEVTVNLTGVTNVQTITVTLFNVNDGTHVGNVPISMGVLVGDVNGNAVVNASDVSLTKAQVGQAVSGSNFREDANANGSINAADVALVKAKVGTALP